MRYLYKYVNSLVFLKMIRPLTFICLFFILPQRLLSQLLPKEGKILNYRLIGFYFPSDKKTINYTIEIASDRLTDESSFRKKIIKTVRCKSNKIILEVPSFGAQYTWRTIESSKSTTTKSELHHFSTGAIPQLDTNSTRLRILKPASKSKKGAFVIIEASKVMYDMEGHPVWYFPDTAGKPLALNDLRVSPQGTFTYLANGNAWEVNYDGDLLWKAPNNGEVSGDTIEYYHHEFTRLSNGHYMVLGNQYADCRIERTTDSATRISILTSRKHEINESVLERQPFGTLIEYDESGKVVWSWKTSDYFAGSDLVNYMTPGGAKIIDVHANAFFFDEKEKTIYISYKRISRILKIKYPEGTTINSYGETYKPGVPETGNSLFCDQHSIGRSHDGHLLLFNDNGCHVGTTPRVEKFKEPLPGNNKLAVAWEYKCTVENGKPITFTTGGNLIELSDGSIFACMGSNYSKTFIVDSNKNVLWSALPEQWDADEKKWKPVLLYRACLIENMKNLERLIWHTENIETSLH